MSDLKTSDLKNHNSDSVLETRDNNYQAFKSLLQHTQHSLIVFSQNFDVRLYDTEEIMTLLQQLALRSRYTNIRILLKDCQQLVKNGHQIIELARRLTSKIQIYQLAKEFTDQHQAFIIGDEKNIIFRPYGDRFEGTVNFNSPVLAKTEINLFEQAWAVSEPSIELRRLHI